MTNKTRRLLINGIWATPVITAISIPAHAQTSCCLVRDLDVTVNNIVCDSSPNPNIGSFTLCNNEGSPLTISDVNSAGNLDPFGAIIEPGACQQFTISINSCTSGTAFSIEAYLWDENTFGVIDISFP